MVSESVNTVPHIGVGTGGGGAEGALAPPILGIMCIKHAEFILDAPFGAPQSCLRSYASAAHGVCRETRTQSNSFITHMLKT